MWKLFSNIRPGAFELSSEDVEQEELAVAFSAPRSNTRAKQPGESEEASLEPISPEAVKVSFKQDGNGTSSILPERTTCIRSLDATGFEHFCAGLLSSYGFSAQVTPQSNDRGVDVFGKVDLGLFSLRIACQCKAYETALVGAPEIRNFAGALIQAGLNHGLFFTTSSFTPEAVIALGDLKKHGISITGIDYRRLITLNKGVSSTSRPIDIRGEQQ